MTDREEIIEAVLLFHRGGPWTEQDQARWQTIVGTPEVTTKALCDWLRSQLPREGRWWWALIYGQGIKADLTGQPREPPDHLNEEQREVWLAGYDR